MWYRSVTATAESGRDRRLGQPGLCRFLVNPGLRSQHGCQLFEALRADGYFTAAEQFGEPLFPAQRVQLGRDDRGGVLVGEADELGVELQGRWTFCVAEAGSDG